MTCGVVFLRTHGLTDGYVVDNTFGPGDTSGWHSHPGPSIIFVVHGTVTNYDSDVPNCAGQVYAAGSSFTDPGGRDVHMLKNEGTQLAETIAVQFLPAGAARKTPAHACRLPGRLTAQPALPKQLSTGTGPVLREQDGSRRATQVLTGSDPGGSGGAARRGAIAIPTRPNGNGSQ